jgi:C4-dicarboxylate-specific signal transduction histidine kinase
VLLSDVVSAAMELVKGQVKENNIKLSLELKNHDIWIQGDTVLLLQVFLNVIVNAIHAVTKSQNETNKICISLEHDDRNVSVFIDDNGPGFHPNIKHQLFHQAYTSKNHGTGIGLLLCHTIMKRANIFNSIITPFLYLTKY